MTPVSGSIVAISGLLLEYVHCSGVRAMLSWPLEYAEITRLVLSPTATAGSSGCTDSVFKRSITARSQIICAFAQTELEPPEFSIVKMVVPSGISTSTGVMPLLLVKLWVKNSSPSAFSVKLVPPHQLSD